MNAWSIATPRNRSFFSNISFRIKIVMGFVAIIALSMIVLSFAYLGYDRVSSGYSSYNAGVGESTIAQTVDHNAAVYRYATRAYVLTGDEVDAEAAQKAEASLRSAIEGSTAAIRSASRQDIIKGLSAKFDASTSLFGQVLQLKRNDFVEAARRIVSEGNALKQKVEDLGDAAMLSDVASIQYGTKTALSTSGSRSPTSTR
jgi:CHASE3 domain sensor protein